MTAKEFTGHIRAMRADTDYFGAEDFVGDQDIPLQIDSVFFDDALKVGAGKAKPTFYLTLKNAAGRDCHKRMLLNASRRKMLAAMYGGMASDWKAKWVWVYVEPVKNPAGGADVLGMKFRNKKDAPRAGAAKPTEPTTEPLGAESLEAVFDRYVEQLTRGKADKLTAIRDAFFGPDAAHKWTHEQAAEGERAYQDRVAELREGAK